MSKKLIIMLVAAMAACTPLASRLAIEPLPATLELRPLVRSVMIRTVSLPTYAAVEEIPLETASGLIIVDEDVLWADDPERAVTLILTRTLTDILDIDVGPAPWPFVGLPDVSVDVQVERMLGGTDGMLDLRGQFFVASEGADYRNTTHSFAITVPMPEPTLIGLAAAQPVALLALAEQIARTLGQEV